MVDFFLHESTFEYIINITFFFMMVNFDDDSTLVKIKHVSTKTNINKLNGVFIEKKF